MVLCLTMLLLYHVSISNLGSGSMVCNFRQTFLLPSIRTEGLKFMTQALIATFFVSDNLDTALFCENYVKLYSDAEHVEKELNRRW